MTSLIPGAKELPIDRVNGQFSMPWRRWLEAVNVALNAAGTDTLSLSAAISEIATALGSPDGTVANIPDQESLDVVIVGRNGVTVTGKAGVSTVNVELTPIDDSGVGAALLKFTRDAYGRLEGTQAATTDDLTEGSTNKYYTAERARDDIGTALVAGTNVTITVNDPGDTITIAAAGGGSGAMTLVGTATVAGSAATNLTLSGLNLDADGHYQIQFTFGNATASNAVLSMYFNADTTATNYDAQSSTIAGAGTPTNARTNNALLCTLEASETATGTIWTRKDLNGRPRSMIQAVRAAPAVVNWQQVAPVWTTAGTNVTGITISSSVASALAVGSFFKVFKVN